MRTRSSGHGAVCRLGGGALRLRAKAEQVLPARSSIASSALIFSCTPYDASSFNRRVWVAQTATVYVNGAARGDYTADAAEWQPPEQWEQLVSVLSELPQSTALLPLSVLVCGSKNTGKSSFARLLVNALLNQHRTVAYLDTDCGQPELTAPGECPHHSVRCLPSWLIPCACGISSCFAYAGLVSLHFLTQPLSGVPSQHQRQPEHARFVGDVSAQSHPLLYSACVQALVDEFRARESRVGATQQRGTPLVANTPGWIKVGLDRHAIVLFDADVDAPVMLTHHRTYRPCPHIRRASGWTCWLGQRSWCSQAMW
jgi:hypothetical protein